MIYVYFVGLSDRYIIFLQLKIWRDRFIHFIIVTLSFALKQG